MIRVSLATASLLGLKKYKIDALPTTLYFELDEKCSGSCKYCSQNNGYLSRVKWPPFNIMQVKTALEDVSINRICIQCPNLDNTAETLTKVVKELNAPHPVSASVGALKKDDLIKLKNNGIERIGVGLDCISKEIFNKWKQRADTWNMYQETLDTAKKIFGSVTCHLIVGLGESDKACVDMMRDLTDRGITIALFALYLHNKTVISLPRYRILQIARYNIEKNVGEITLKNNKIIEIYDERNNGDAFITSGCPGCNRPFYNERVTKIYNFPYAPNRNEIKNALMEANNYARIRSIN